MINGHVKPPANPRASEYSPKSERLVPSVGFFACFYPFPEALVVQGHTVVIHQNIGDESSCTAGVTIFTVRQTKIFLRSEEHTLNSSHSQISYAVFCLKKK